MKSCNALALVLALSAGVPKSPATTPEPVLFSGLGSYARSVTTGSPEAQRWFNQGLNWYYAFNFDEAQIAFRKAAEVDPSCAMAWWGLSEAAGPQYNHPLMDEQRTAVARDAMHEALKCLDNTTPVERALIEALKHRNALEKPDPKQRSEHDKAYAAALQSVWEANPTDPDVGTLFANARMTVRPWQLYETATRRPTGDTDEIRGIIENVLALSPQHPGALHLYIHVVEPGTNPALALSVANRLDNLVPASGHMRHMPTHIYVQTGHWDRAVFQNAEAMGADTAYRARAPGRTAQIGYQIHNAHMLAFAAMMSARRSEATAAAQAMWDMWGDVPDDTPASALAPLASYIDTVMPAVYDAQKRFGDWDGILAAPEPPRPDYLPITTAIRHAARAVAYANKGEIEHAQQELARFEELKNAFADDLQFRADNAKLVLDVSLHFARGEIELNRENWDAAAGHLNRAIEIEDGLAYTEPPQYLQPTRHALGAVYMRSGDPARAARVFRQDLKKWPGNVWSLHGLYRALEAQGENGRAARTKLRLDRAKRFADFPVDSSCVCLRNL